QRAIVARPKGHPRDVELGSSVTLQIGSRLSPQRLTQLIVALDSRFGSEMAERLREGASIAGVAHSHRTPFDLVALQQAIIRDAFAGRCELPPQVDRVLDGCVVAEPAGGREQVDSIATEHDASALKVLGDERMAGSPRPARKEFCADGCAD